MTVNRPLLLLCIGLFSTARSILIKRPSSSFQRLGVKTSLRATSLSALLPSSLRPQTFEGLRGVQTLTTTTPTQVIAQVPAKYCVEVTNNRPPTPFPHFVSQATWGQSLWYQRMAFKLLHDKFSSNADKKRTWIADLPTSFGTPFHWTDEQLHELRCPSMITKVQQQRIEWKNFYDMWQQQQEQACNDISATTAALSADQISFEQLVWAMEVCNSRAFSGPYEGTSASERISLLTFTAALTVLWPALHLATLEQSSGLACIAVLSLFLRDLFTSRSGAYKRYVLCPGIDLFNHKSGCTSDVSYNYFRDCFELRVSKAAPTLSTQSTTSAILPTHAQAPSPPGTAALSVENGELATTTPFIEKRDYEQYDPGEQVFINYGKQSNDRFLQFYGFVEPDNPNDVYDFGAGIIDLLIKYVDWFEHAGVPAGMSYAIPQQPSAQQRLRYIAQAVLTPDAQAGESVRDTAQTQQRRPVNTTAHTVQYHRRALTAATSSQDQYAPHRELSAHFDPTTVSSLRSLYCTQQEFEQRSGAGIASSFTLASFATPCCDETEDAVVWALRCMASLELQSFPTSLEDDQDQLHSLLSAPAHGDSTGAKSSGLVVDSPCSDSVSNAGQHIPPGPAAPCPSPHITALMFRIERKKLLRDIVGTQA